MSVILLHSNIFVSGLYAHNRPEYVRLTSLLLWIYTKVSMRTHYACQNWAQIYVNPREGTPIPGQSREVLQWWPPILCLISIWLTPSFCRKKNGLSLSHLVPEILGPTVSLIFHQNNVLFISFYAFCSNLLLDFRSNWTPFSLILDLLTPRFYKNLHPIGSKFWSCAEPGYQTFGEVSSLPPRSTYQKL